MKADIAVIGCGITGITLAHFFAGREKREVLIIEKRDHVGGQCYDFRNEHGHLLMAYGAHIFHTMNEEVWRFLNNFTEFNDYVHYVKIKHNGRFYDWPITLDTINAVYGTSVDADEAEQLLKAEAYDSGEDNFENAITRQIGVVLYEMFIKNYTEKMWGRPCRELSPRLAFRVPLRLNNDKRLFTDPYQGIPKSGYTEMFRAMLDSPRIQILPQTDYCDVLPSLDYELLFVTSPIDEFYDHYYGKLEYRGMRFEWETFDVESYQPVGTVNTPDHPELLRVEENKKYFQQQGPKTTICFNYPCSDGCFYPMQTEENFQLAQQYLRLAARERNVFFVGRLGRYQYINMDQAVAMAFAQYRWVCDRTA